MPCKTLVGDVRVSGVRIGPVRPHGVHVGGVLLGSVILAGVCISSVERLWAVRGRMESVAYFRKEVTTLTFKFCFIFH